jgi:ParB family chromosome partitioning protein
VRDAKGEETAQLIDHLKKPDMAKEAERLLADSGWLPEPLRLSTPDDVNADDDGAESDALPAFLAEDEDSEDDGTDDPQAVAAE